AVRRGGGADRAVLGHLRTLGFLGLVGLVTAVAGLVGTSRPRVAGRALAPFGLVLSLIVLAVLGLRYLGVDTAFGDRITPSLIELLERLNARLPAP
ncbi:MAG: hypothetical protein ACRDPR_07370, partial [Nocardioidaceae bacterium]